MPRIAMKMEQDGEIFHRELAKNTNNPGFREIYARWRRMKRLIITILKIYSQCRNK